MRHFLPRVLIWVVNDDTWLSPVSDRLFSSVFVSDSEFSLTSDELLFEREESPLEVIEYNILGSIVPGGGVDTSIPVNVSAQRSGPFGFACSSWSPEK